MKLTKPPKKKQDVDPNDPAVQAMLNEPIGGKAPANSAPIAPEEPATPRKAASRKPKPIPARRDTFSMPASDHDLIDKLRARSAPADPLNPLNKSEIVRLGLHALEAMSDEALLKMAADLPRQKPGRAKQHSVSQSY